MVPLLINWRRKWQPTLVFLPGESQGWRSLVGCHLWGRMHALEEEMATYSSILTWRIPRMEEPGGLLSMGSHRVGDDWSVAAKSLQLSLTLCDPTDGSPPGSPVPGILQARTLEWVAISCSNAWKWKFKVKSLSNHQLLHIIHVCLAISSISNVFCSSMFCQRRWIREIII